AFHHVRPQPKVDRLNLSKRQRVVQLLQFPYVLWHCVSSSGDYAAWFLPPQLTTKYHEMQYQIVHCYKRSCNDFTLNPSRSTLHRATSSVHAPAAPGIGYNV